MTTGTKVLLTGGVFTVAALIFAGSVFFWGMGVRNKAVTLHNTYDSKVLTNETEFDNMFKKINQVAQVSDASKDALKEIFVGYASARNTGGAKDGSLMKWITESVPNVDTNALLYKDLMNTIVSSRNSWTARQVELVEIAREYNLMVDIFPQNIVMSVFGYTKIDAKIVTSSRTEEAFRTGKDDDTDLNLKSKPTPSPEK
jgi:hypothetical protein